MKKTIGTILVVGAIVTAFALGKAQAQEAGGDMESMMKAWKDLGTPGPQHAELKKMVGEWTAHMERTDPMTGQAIKEEGKCKYSMILNGLILRQDFEGVMDGQKFKGVGFMAFNKGSGKYESIWMDDMSSGIMYSAGDAPEKGKPVTFAGHWFGPDAAKVDQKTVMTNVDDDTHTLKMQMNMGGNALPPMTITYKRVK